MKLYKNRLALAALTLGALAASPAPYAFAGTSDEIKALKERLKQLEAKVSAEHRSNIANQAHGNINVKGPVPVGPPPVFVSFNNGVFIETEDHAYNFKFGGRLQFDAGVSSVPLNGQSGNAGIRRARFDWSGKANRIWLYAFQYDFAGSTQSNFAGTGGFSQRGGIRDAWLGLRHPALVVPYATEPLLIQVGHMYEPFSLEALNSDVVTDFIERPLAVDGFAPFRHLGAAVSAHGENWTVKGGVYSTSFETDNTNVPGVNTPATIGLPRGPFGTGANYASTGGGQYYDITGRATYAPIYDEHNLLHLGIAGRYHRPNDSTAANDTRVMTPGSNLRSEANVLNQAVLGTPDLSCGTVTIPGSAAVFNTSSIAGKCVRDVFTYGFEVAAAYGPVSLQAEYIGTQYNRNFGALTQAALLGIYTPGGTSEHFDGYYVSGNWWVTGEEKAKSYNVKDTQGATIGAPKILAPFSAGGPGAVGLIARYSSINLNSGPRSGSSLYNALALFPTSTAANNAARSYIANSGVYGGRQENVTAGVQWYPDNGIHIQATWTRALTLSAPLTATAAPGYFNSAHPDIFEVRTTVYW